MPPDDLDAGSKDRDFYTAQSFQRAFGTQDQSVIDPTLGFTANRDRLLQLYTYYQTIAQAQPNLFLWIGLGHLAGGTIVSGLDMAGDSSITQILVSTAKSIFLDLAWLHEAYLDSPDTAISLAQVRDASAPTPAASYAQAFTDIASLDTQRVADGNLALLRNEQACLVQPGMDILAQQDSFFFNRSVAFTRSVHPYHRDFILVMPQGKISSFDDRWAWINEPDGMWAKWIAMPSVAPDERNRLIGLGLDVLMARNFGPVVDALLPAGGTDEEG